MGSQTAMSNDGSRMNWTPIMERYFLDLMLEHSHRGNRVGHTFNKLAWNDMLTMFNTKLAYQYDKDVLKNRYATLWKQFNDVHPDARCYRTKSVQNCDDLCVIYGSTIADGRYSLSSHDARLDDEAQTLQLGDELESVASSSNEHPRTNWTASMDRFFIELLVDQLGRGNKVYNSVWNTYVKAHPHARTYRMNTLPNYHDLELLFRNESDDVMSNLHQEKNLQDAIYEINPGGKFRGSPSQHAVWIRT